MGKKNHFLALFQILIIFSVLLSACNAIKYSKRDPFYNDGNEWDHLRFPLIKPYYAILLPDGDGWYIPLEVSPSDKEIYYYLNIHDVQKIAVENGVILVYTQYPKPVDEEAGEKVLYWFAIVPDENIEVGFETEIELNDYIQHYGIENPEWREPDDLSLEYAKTWCLNWIPGCE